jgi:hypothetical protein
MDSKINTKELNAVLQVLTAALVEAREINKSGDVETRDAIGSFLMRIEKEATSFFSKHVDRREVPIERNL